MSKIHSVGKTKLLGRIDAISKQNVCRVRVGVGATGAVSSKMSELGEKHVDSKTRESKAPGAPMAA